MKIVKLGSKRFNRIVFEIILALVGILPYYLSLAFINRSFNIGKFQVVSRLILLILVVIYLTVVGIKLYMKERD